MHVRHLLDELGVRRRHRAACRRAAVALRRRIILVQQTEQERLPLDRVRAGWDDLVVRRVIRNP